VPETNAEATQLADKGKNPGPKQTEWKTTSDGIKWLPDCDFPGYDIKYEYIGGRCSPFQRDMQLKFCLHTSIEFTVDVK
jgi:hypothetical protein